MEKNSIAKAINDYLDGKLSLKELHSYVLGFDWDNLPSTLTNEQRLMGKIELYLTEISEGFCSEDDLREFLRKEVITCLYSG